MFGALPAGLRSFAWLHVEPRPVPELAWGVNLLLALSDPSRVLPLVELVAEASRFRGSRREDLELLKSGKAFASVAAYGVAGRCCCRRGVAAALIELNAMFIYESTRNV